MDVSFCVLQVAASMYALYRSLGSKAGLNAMPTWVVKSHFVFSTTYILVTILTGIPSLK
jgi:hypothetical protein